MFLLILWLVLTTGVLGFPWFRNDIPNGYKVPDPCTGQTGQIWEGVGHNQEPGGGPRNPFGLDFKTVGFKWTKELCQKDSDKDGRTNGEELGDPGCTWTKGGTPSAAASGHPGICEPMSNSSCVTVNKDIMCPSNTG
ncbi:temptin-like [Mytilus galloprovincialis]|uniref:temptin-like n=1 Tax=Mytilus galloprovincialis TaxID=29158 RepID=UPI003F7C21BE